MIYNLYISDELSMWFVTSTKAHANIVSIDPSAALAVPGVVDYVDCRDVPGNNDYGPLVHDIPLFAKKEVRKQLFFLRKTDCKLFFVCLVFARDKKIFWIIVLKKK